jgi:hypothetical protein
MHPSRPAVRACWEPLPLAARDGWRNRPRRCRTGLSLLGLLHRPLRCLSHNASRRCPRILDARWIRTRSNRYGARRGLLPGSTCGLSKLVPLRVRAAERVVVLPGRQRQHHPNRQPISRLVISRGRVIFRTIGRHSSHRRLPEAALLPDGFGTHRPSHQPDRSHRVCSAMCSLSHRQDRSRRACSGMCSLSHRPGRFHRACSAIYRPNRRPDRPHRASSGIYRPNRRPDRPHRASSGIYRPSLRLDRSLRACSEMCRRNRRPDRPRRARFSLREVRTVREARPQSKTGRKIARTNGIRSSFEAGEPRTKRLRLATASVPSTADTASSLPDRASLATPTGR